ncbi:hypothetical protein JW868_00465 [Candidatus Woesearchaeota archaeon]|nr:hypothetical protein [Candidatus Woesearchaeota archaeon]
MAFNLSDGNQLHSVEDLKKFLKKDNSEVFQYHVGPDHNHFSDWIKHELHDPELADKLNRAKTPSQFLAAIEAKEKTKILTNNIGSLKDMLEESRKRLRAQEQILVELEGTLGSDDDDDEDGDGDHDDDSEEEEGGPELSDDMLRSIEQESLKFLAQKEEETRTETFAPVQKDLEGPSQVFEAIPLHELKQSTTDLPEEFKNLGRDFESDSIGPEPEPDPIQPQPEPQPDPLEQDILQEALTASAKKSGFKAMLQRLYKRNKSKESDVLANIPLPSESSTRTQNALLHLMVTECKGLIDEGRIEDAKSKYMELRNEFNDIDYDVKMQFQKDVLDIYNKLK